MLPERSTTDPSKQAVLDAQFLVAPHPRRNEDHRDENKQGTTKPESGPERVYLH